MDLFKTDFSSRNSGWNPKYRNQFFQCSFAILCKFIRFCCNGWIYCCKQYFWIFVCLCELHHTGLHEFYQPELVLENGNEWIKILRNCILLSVTVSVVLGGVSYPMGPHLLRIYTSDAAVVQCGMEILLIYNSDLFYVRTDGSVPRSSPWHGILSSTDALSVIGTVGTRIIWIIWVFPKHRSLDVLFISYPASWFITIVLQVICYCFVRKKINRLKI